MLSSNLAIWIALILTFVLCGLHFLAPVLRRLTGISEPLIVSFSGGLAVSYVFLNTLPALIESHRTFGQQVEVVARGLDPELRIAILNLTIFITALVGFTVYYGLELVGRACTKDGSDRRSFFVHLSSFCIYNGLITYTLPVRIQLGWPFALLFTLAMGLHFLIIDRGLERHYPRLFESRGRLLLMGALLVGWVLAALTQPVNVLGVALVVAFLCGATLLNVFKEQLPTESDSSFPAFVVGLGLGAGILILLTWLRG